MPILKDAKEAVVQTDPMVQSGNIAENKFGDAVEVRPVDDCMTEVQSAARSRRCGKLRRPSLAASAVSNWAALGINMLVGFLLTPYIIASLGMSSYGIWALVISVVGYYGLLDLGVSSAILRYVARYSGQNDCVRLNEVMNTSIAIFSFVGLSVAAVTCFLALPLSRFFNVDPAERMLFTRSIILLGITAGVMFPSNVLNVAIIAHERFATKNILLIVCSILRALLIVAVLSSGGNIVGLSIVNLGVCIFGVALNYVVVKRYFPHIRFSWRMCKRTVMRSLLTFGFFSCISQVGNLLRTRVGAAVIGRFGSMALVGVYNVSLLMYMYALKLIISCSGVFQPRLSALAGVADRKAFSDSVMRYSMIVSNFTVAVGVTGCLLCSDFLKLWLPDNFGDTTGTEYVFYILLFSLVPNMMTDVSVSALQAVKKHKYVAYQTISEGVINLSLAIYLVGKLGIVGVAIAAAVPAVVARVIVQPIYCCKILGLSWKSYMRQIMAVPLSVFLTMIFVSKYSGILFVADSYPQLIAKGAIVFSLYSLAAFFVCIDSRMRGEVIERILRTLSGASGFLTKKIALDTESGD